MTLFARRVRLYGFGALAFFGIVPSAHWLTIAPLVYTDRIIMGALVMFAWYGLGFVFLFTRFPESVWPKSFWATHVVPSHTLWHIAVAAAAFTWLAQILDFQTLILSVGCEPYHSIQTK